MSQEKIKKESFHLLLLCMSVFPACMFVCHICAMLIEVRGGHNIPWKWMIMSQHVGVGNESRFSGKASSTLNY